MRVQATLKSNEREGTFFRAMKHLVMLIDEFIVMQAAAQIAVQSEENVPLELTYERIAAPASTVLKAAKSW